MQVSVESTSALSRKLTVRVPEDKIQEKMEARFNTLARQIKLDGFRPGKVPPHVVKKMFAGQVRNEVIGDLIESTLVDALREHDLRPAGTPHIAPQPFDEGAGLEYTASFEVYPEIKLNPVSELEVRREVSSVTDADLDAMIERLREQRKTWSVVDRKAAEGDRVTITFSGSADGEEFTDGKVESYPVILGSGTMIPGFEEKLVGAEAGGELSFDIDFPADYGNEKLAGKSARFDVEVTKVEAAQLPEVDAEFVKAFGVESGDVEVFRSDVKANMERELQRAIRSHLKTAVMDALYAGNSIVVPNSLVDAEIDRMMEPYVKSAKEKHLDPKDVAKREDFEASAKRRVTLGLLLSDVIKENNIKADPGRVRAAVEEMAASYEQPEDVVKWYYANQEHLANVEQMVLEDQVVEWIAERAKVVDVPVSFDALMNPKQ